MYNKILITGASGFLGKELIKRLYNKNKIVALARNEGELIKLQLEYPNIEIITGDVSDKFICEKACKDVKEIYHLAAFKHVGLAEEQTRECVKSNIIGTINLLDQTLFKDIDFIIGISTDKAVQISGVYGATKFIMEKLFQEYEKINSDCKYRIVRYGNVLYSTGSVLCKWKDKLLKGKEIIITNPNATRFYWTITQAIDHIFECIKSSLDSTPYIPSMKSMRMGDLLEAMMMKYGKVSIKETNLQEGENMHEKLSKEGLDSSQTEHYTIDEIITMI